MRWWGEQIPSLTTCWCKKRSFVSNKISACRLDCISYSKKNNINRTISAIVLLLWQLISPNSSSNNTNNPNILLQITQLNPSIRRFSITHQSLSDSLRATTTTTHFQILMWTTTLLTTLTRAEQSVLRSYLALTQTSQHRETTICITITSRGHILRSAITKSSSSLFRVTALSVFNLLLVGLLLSQGWNRT
jgi:hypothetical protein